LKVESKPPSNKFPLVLKEVRKTTIFQPPYQTYEICYMYFSSDVYVRELLKLVYCLGILYHYTQYIVQRERERDGEKEREIIVQCTKENMFVFMFSNLT